MNLLEMQIQCHINFDDYHQHHVQIHLTSKSCVAKLSFQFICFLTATQP